MSAQEVKIEAATTAEDSSWVWQWRIDGGGIEILAQGESLFA